MLAPFSLHAQWDIHELRVQPGKPANEDACFPGQFEKTTHKEIAWYLQGKKNDDRIAIMDLSTGDIRWRSKSFFQISRSSIVITDVDGDGIDEIVFSAREEASSDLTLYVIRGSGNTFIQTAPPEKSSFDSGSNLESISKQPDAATQQKTPADTPVAAESLLPANLHASIQFSVPQRALVRVDIFNGRGDLVNTMVNEETDPGDYTKIWDGTDNQGNRLKAGNYFYKVTIGKLTEMRKPVVF